MNVDYNYLKRSSGCLWDEELAALENARVGARNGRIAKWGSFLAGASVIGGLMLSPIGFGGVAAGISVLAGAASIGGIVLGSRVQEKLEKKEKMLQQSIEEKQQSLEDLGSLSYQSLQAKRSEQPIEVIQAPSGRKQVSRGVRF